MEHISLSSICVLGHSPLDYISNPGFRTVYFKMIHVCACWPFWEQLRAINRKLLFQLNQLQKYIIEFTFKVQLGHFKMIDSRSVRFSVGLLSHQHICCATLSSHFLPISASDSLWSPPSARPRVTVSCKTAVQSFAFWTRRGERGRRSYAAFFLPPRWAACLSALLVCMQDRAGCPLFAPISLSLCPSPRLSFLPSFSLLISLTAFRSLSTFFNLLSQPAQTKLSSDLRSLKYFCPQWF